MATITVDSVTQAAVPGGEWGQMESRDVAGILRGLRADAHLSTRQLAAALGWSQARVSRIELGSTRASAEDATAWASATGATAEVMAELAALIEQADAYQVRPWKTVHSKGLAATQRDVARVEAAMTGLRNFQCALIPGLLQTAAYARTDLEVADVTGRGGVAEAVAARMNRQDILYDPARDFVFVLTAGALHPYFPLPAEVARSQADRLVSVATLPNVTIAVIPATAQPGEPYLSSFTLFEVDPDPVVLVELFSTELLLGGADDVSLYRETFARFQGAAVTGDDAEALIREALTST
jgi:transcriptional regulator with XRE-family HTH domain